MTAAICCRGTCISAMWPLMSCAPATRSIRATYRGTVLQNWNRWNICETFVKHLRHLWIRLKKHRNLEVTQFYSVLLSSAQLLVPLPAHDQLWRPTLMEFRPSVEAKRNICFIFTSSDWSASGSSKINDICSWHSAPPKFAQQSLLLYLHASVLRQRPVQSVHWQNSRWQPHYLYNSLRFSWLDSGLSMTCFKIDSATLKNSS